MSARIVTVPNLLTVFRMVLIPVFVSLLFYQRFSIALGIFILAGVSEEEAPHLEALESVAQLIEWAEGRNSGTG